MAILKYLKHIVPNIFNIPDLSIKDIIIRVIKLLYHSLGHRNTFANLIILFISVVGLVSSLIRYELIGSLKPDQHTFILYYIVWICVLFSSITCCKIYFDIFMELHQTRRDYVTAWQKTIQNFNKRPPFCCLALSSIVSLFVVGDLFVDMLKWKDKIEEYRLPAMKFYYILFVSRIVQRSLACALITLIMPVTQDWLALSSHQIKEHIVHLLPWQLFHTLQRLLVSLCVNSQISVGFVLIQMYKLWIVLLALKIANDYIFPVIHQPRADTNSQRAFIYDTETDKEVVTGLTKPVANYPEKAELVRGRALERFKRFLQPVLSNPETKRREERTQSERRDARYSNQEVSYETPHRNEDHIVDDDAAIKDEDATEIVEDVNNDPVEISVEGIRQRTLTNAPQQ